MNRRLTHMLVGIVTAVLLLAAVGFSLRAVASGQAGVSVTWPALPRIAHPAKNRMAECARCHETGEYAAPLNHRTYEVGTCLTCHRVAPAAGVKAGGEGEAGPVTHPVTAPYDDCVGCHAIGENLSMPGDHADYGNEGCADCHEAGVAGKAGAARQR